MTLEEAQIIGRIVGTADGGCATCVGRLTNRLNAAFPEFSWTPTDEILMEQPDWSDDPNDAAGVGFVVAARPR